MVDFTTRPELSGTFGAVATTHWIASAVGMKLLEAGGNAFDAAAAAGFVLQIVEPHLNGPGGDAPILVAKCDDTEPRVICGQGGAPASATIGHFQALGLDMIPGTGLLAACVPGAFGAWLTMLRDWGTMPLRVVLEPAIEYARSGHPILENAVGAIASVHELFLSDWTTSAEVFLKDGKVPEAGSLFANPTLARLYDDIIVHAEAASGDRVAQIDAALAYWYEGPVAHAIDRFCRSTEALDVSGKRHSGLLTAEDMAGWRPPVERPVRAEYRGIEVFKCGPWSQGPSMLQALKILEGYDLSAFDPEGPEFVHLLAETIKLAMADRDAWYGDESDVPLDVLLSSEYAETRRSLIGAEASLELRPGTVGDRRPHLPRLDRPQQSDRTVSGMGGGEPTFAQNTGAAIHSAKRPAEDNRFQRGDTCHIDIIDRWGNMVSATPSGGWLQSSPIIPDLGFALGTRMQMFWLQSGHPNALAPRKRPRTTLTPSMAYKNNRPWLAFGTPGGDQQEQWSLQLLIRHVDHGQPLQAAIDAPAFHTDHIISSFWPRGIDLGGLALEGRYPAQTIEELRRKGHCVKVGGQWSEGRLSACSREATGEDGLIRAGANPRGAQGYAIAR